MKTGSATYLGEEIQVAFSAVAERCDYGVPRSPVWVEWAYPVITSVSILGIEVDVNKLPVDLQEALQELADEVEFEAD